jgi:hypothetical protein
VADDAFDVRAGGGFDAECDLAAPRERDRSGVAGRRDPVRFAWDVERLVLGVAVGDAAPWVRVPAAVRWLRVNGFTAAPP